MEKAKLCGDVRLSQSDGGSCGQVNPGEQPKWGPADPTGGPVLGMPANITGSFDEISDGDHGVECDYEAWDDVKETPLNPELVIKARKVEMQYVSQHNVYSYAKVSECLEATGAQPIDTRWLDTNKGDQKCPIYRSR